MSDLFDEIARLSLLFRFEDMDPDIIRAGIAFLRVIPCECDDFNGHDCGCHYRAQLVEDAEKELEQLKSRK